MIIIAFALALSGQTTTPPLPTDSSAVPIQTAEATTATPSNGTAAEERRAGRPLVCRNEPVVGSRFPVRRCRPADLTPEERALAADQLRRQQIGTLNGS
ncbi:hypothetical protein [Brevundimonas sp. SL130]|uniref:hypothetical protein n=1 Tax=Brevundimonas sp. SL130 TaxID=2995143 RepID=UPI00226D036C|nr:hypothetical protein [Brevundimonas sp. SL130]WAC59407.1 hypothetical protein OU998_14485 [Brevundimonas sp. SL130]